MISLRQYQQQITDRIRMALRQGFKAPLVVSPTGSGKTVIFANIAQRAIQRNNRILILTHRKEILEQTLSKLFSFGVQSGQIASGKPITNDLAQVAMVNTISRILHKIKKPTFIIADEAHHFLKSNIFGKTINYFKDVPLIGFTATPERLSGEGLGVNSDGFFDCLIKGPTINDLVKAGYLSYPIIYRPPQEIINQFHLKRGDYDKDEMEYAYTRKAIIGDVISHYRQHLNYKPTVCFCVSIKHCEIMADEFINAGYVAVALSGKMKKSDREAAIAGLANGSIHVLMSCDLISEGLDIPVMAGAILLRKTLSLTLFMQQVGRPLRKYPGKENAIILDHAGNYYLHGHILAEREWSLDRGKRNHKKEKPPAITSCPKCFGVWPGELRICPGQLPDGTLCRFNFSDIENILKKKQRKNPKTIEGELIEAMPEGTNEEKIKDLSKFLAKIQSYSPKMRQKALIAKSFELQNKKEISVLAKAIGYKQNWSSWVWKNILKNR